MSGEATFFRNAFLTALLTNCLLSVPLCAQDGMIRSKALLNFSFDEANGDAQDSATAGAVKDVGQLVNGASRIKSPFANQKGKQALILDGARKQFVQVADGADVDRSNAVTVSFFYLHLGSPEDAGFQSLFAKRLEGASGATNYGINFVGKSDLLQVYLNDTAGYKLVPFGVQQVLGFRRPNFVTVSYEVTDAPGDDADQDQDDVLIRMYLNGQPQTPRAQAGVQIASNDAWILNVNIPGLLNDTPFTIGSSTATIEFASGVFDEFSIFGQALTPEEVAKLFVETAGPNASSAVLAETLPPLAPAPALTMLSMNGAQLGASSTLVIYGTNLQPTPTVMLPVPGAKVALGPNTNANQIEVQLTLPPDAPVGHYPVRVQTQGGISNVLPLAVDGLIEVAANGSSPEKPLTLPVAVSGTLSGQAQSKAYFAGKAGQRVIADIESRRLGAAMLPVIEIKSARGTPLRIEWGHVEFSGDCRADVVLPADGLYYVEVHDLSYNAPGVNPFRLKIGDLKLADVALGGARTGVENSLDLSGPGIDPNTKLTVDLRTQSNASGVWPLPAALGIAAPAPQLIVSPGPEFVEATPPAGSFQSVEGKLANPPLPIGFTGVLSQPKERDVILLQVTPGQNLLLSVSGVAVNSPIDPQIQVLQHPTGNPLASAENPGTREAAVGFTVPADQSQVQVAIRDLRSRGGASFRYRLRIAPAGQVDFNLALSTDRVQLAADGSTAFQMDVQRGGYNGPIKLGVKGDPQVAIAPAVIPAGINKLWVTLTRQGVPAMPGSLAGIQIVGESADLDPPLIRNANVPADPRLNLLPSDRITLGTGHTSPVGASLELGAVPTLLFKGVDFTVPMKLKVSDQPRTRIARLSLLSTEAPRPNNPGDPNQGQKPRVDGSLNQIIDADDPQSGLKINVPLDIADPNIDFVIKAELVEHPFARNVAGTLYSTPFRLTVQNAVTVQPATNNLMVTGGVAAKFTGTIKRTAGYTGPVNVQILNLPAGSAVPPVTVAPDQEAFELSVMTPAVTAATDVANVVLRVTAADTGNPINPDLPLATKISSPAK